jgi:hypothetical protein
MFCSAVAHQVCGEERLAIVIYEAHTLAIIGT